MTRVAVIGVGAMGKNHARNYHEMPETQLVAVVDQDLATAQQIGHEYGVPFYTDFAEMLIAEQPEAASIAVPTESHYEVAKAMLAAGCHVLIEKPIAVTVAEADDLTAMATRIGRVLAVGHIERFNPAIVELKRRIQAGELGRIFQIHARRLGPFPSRIKDVGVVMDLAVHDLDIMRYLLDAEVALTFTETKRELHTQCEDLFIGVLRFTDSTVGLLEINWLTPTRIRKLYVTGERGMFTVNYLTQELLFYENAETTNEKWSPVDLLPGVSQGAELSYPIKKQEPLRAELEAFIARTNGQASPIVDGFEATTTLALAKSMVNPTWNKGAKKVTNDENGRRSATNPSPHGIEIQSTKVPFYQAGD